MKTACTPDLAAVSQIEEDAHRRSSSGRVRLICRKLWDFMGCSIDELALRSEFPSSAKTLWRLIRTNEAWSTEQSRPLLTAAAAQWAVPIRDLEDFVAGEYEGSPRLLELLASRFWQCNPRSADQLAALVGEYEAGPGSWIWAGPVPTIFPDRPMRRFLRHWLRHAPSPAASEAVVRLCSDWRDRLMNSMGVGHPMLVISPSLLPDAKECRGPFCRFNGEDSADFISSLAYDLVQERGFRIALVPQGAVNVSGVRHLLDHEQFLAITSDFCLHCDGVRPVLRTLEGGASRYQAAVVRDYQVGLRQSLLGIDGAMGADQSFEYVRSFMD